MTDGADDEPRPPQRMGAKPKPPEKKVPPTEAATRPGSTFVPNQGKDKPKASHREIAPVSGGPGFVERIVFGRVSTGHIAQFSRQFAAYLSAGVDLLRSLDNLQTQFAKTALGPVIGRVAQGVRSGDSLTEAMGREPQAFDTQFLAMMTVAEARGGVPETLKMMAAGYEAKQRLIRQARSAMIYPIAVISIAFGVGMLLTIFVLPTLVGILEDTVQGKAISLPLPTRILIGINRFMVSVGWLAVPLGLAGSVFGLIWLYRKPAGKALLDEIAMRLPVLGKLLKMIDTSRFAKTLSVLLEAGVDIGASLDLTSGVMNLVPFRRSVIASREAVMEGAELSEALTATGRFPSDLIAIVNSGEETGKLPESLDRVSKDYEERIEFMIKNLSSLIQPLIFVMLGGVVLFIALAFIMAYLQVIAGLGG